jgi:hypothetical protein
MAQKALSQFQVVHGDSLAHVFIFALDTDGHLWRGYHQYPDGPDVKWERIQNPPHNKDTDL